MLFFHCFVFCSNVCDVVTEEDILSNNEESEEFLEFLSILGQTVKLQGFTG